MIPNRHDLAFDQQFSFGFSWSTKSECVPIERESTRCPKMAVRLCSNNRLSFTTTTTIITHKLPQTTRLSAMISTLQINIALRRAFKDRYQKRETKAKASLKGETVQSSVSIVTGKTTAATTNRPNQEKKEPNAGRAPSPEKGYRHGWNQEILATLRYSTSTFRMGL
ncbi:hypothetical protein EV421DRAFT_1028500 [Armillaria borealis]|uniref:Uncharacterized protein n=1 Tax=Armillaria borealis TaxID=47425 RepID=A0AA39MKS6_9AGAR|nr:hypothetical protein EV421DRAFT_1028500 [Armillaria borealis]